jgi:hypothetical protein
MHSSGTRGNSKSQVWRGVRDLDRISSTFSNRSMFSHRSLIMGCSFWTDCICISFCCVYSIGRLCGQLFEDTQIHSSIQDPLHRLPEYFCELRLHLQYSRYLSGQGVLPNPLGVDNAGRRYAQPVGDFLRGCQINIFASMPKRNKQI